MLTSAFSVRNGVSELSDVSPVNIGPNCIVSKFSVKTTASTLFFEKSFLKNLFEIYFMFIVWIFVFLIR